MHLGARSAAQTCASASRACATRSSSAASETASRQNFELQARHFSRLSNISSRISNGRKENTSTSDTTTHTNPDSNATTGTQTGAGNGALPAAPVEEPDPDVAAWAKAGRDPIKYYETIVPEIGEPEVRERQERKKVAHKEKHIIAKLKKDARSLAQIALQTIEAEKIQKKAEVEEKKSGDDSATPSPTKSLLDMAADRSQYGMSRTDRLKYKTEEILKTLKRREGILTVLQEGDANSNDPLSVMDGFADGEELSALERRVKERFKEKDEVDIEGLRRAREGKNDPRHGPSDSPGVITADINDTPVSPDAWFAADAYEVDAETHDFEQERLCQSKSKRSPVPSVAVNVDAETSDATASHGHAALNNAAGGDAPAAASQNVDSPLETEEKQAEPKQANTDIHPEVQESQQLLQQQVQKAASQPVANASPTPKPVHHQVQELLQQQPQPLTPSHHSQTPLQDQQIAQQQVANQVEHRDSNTGELKSTSLMEADEVDLAKSNIVVQTRLQGRFRKKIHEAEDIAMGLVDENYEMNRSVVKLLELSQDLVSRTREMQLLEEEVLNQDSDHMRKGRNSRYLNRFGEAADPLTAEVWDQTLKEILQHQKHFVPQDWAHVVIALSKMWGESGNRNATGLISNIDDGVEVAGADINVKKGRGRHGRAAGNSKDGSVESMESEGDLSNSHMSASEVSAAQDLFQSQEDGEVEDCFAQEDDGAGRTKRGSSNTSRNFKSESANSYMRENVANRDLDFYFASVMDAANRGDIFGEVPGRHGKGSARSNYRGSNKDWNGTGSGEGHRKGSSYCKGYGKGGGPGFPRNEYQNDYPQNPRGKPLPGPGGAGMARRYESGSSNSRPPVPFAQRQMRRYYSTGEIMQMQLMKSFLATHIRAFGSTSFDTLMRTSPIRLAPANHANTTSKVGDLGAGFSVAAGFSSEFAEKMAAINRGTTGNKIPGGKMGKKGKHLDQNRREADVTATDAFSRAAETQWDRDLQNLGGDPDLQNLGGMTSGRESHSGRRNPRNPVQSTPDHTLDRDLNNLMTKKELAWGTSDEATVVHNDTHLNHYIKRAKHMGTSRGGHHTPMASRTGNVPLGLGLRGRASKDFVQKNSNMEEVDDDENPGIGMNRNEVSAVFRDKPKRAEEPAGSGEFRELNNPLSDAFAEAAKEDDVSDVFGEVGDTRTTGRKSRQTDNASSVPHRGLLHSKDSFKEIFKDPLFQSGNSNTFSGNHKNDVFQLKTMPAKPLSFSKEAPSRTKRFGPSDKNIAGKGFADVKRKEMRNKLNEKVEFVDADTDADLTPLEPGVTSARSLLHLYHEVLTMALRGLGSPLLDINPLPPLLVVKLMQSFEQLDRIPRYDAKGGRQTDIVEADEESDLLSDDYKHLIQALRPGVCAQLGRGLKKTVTLFKNEREEVKQMRRSKVGQKELKKKEVAGRISLKNEMGFNPRMLSDGKTIASVSTTTDPSLPTVLNVTRTEKRARAVGVGDSSKGQNGQSPGAYGGSNSSSDDLDNIDFDTLNTSSRRNANVDFDEDEDLNNRGRSGTSIDEITEQQHENAVVERDPNDLTFDELRKVYLQLSNMPKFYEKFLGDEDMTQLSETSAEIFEAKKLAVWERERQKLVSEVEKEEKEKAGKSQRTGGRKKSGQTINTSAACLQRHLTHANNLDNIITLNQEDATFTQKETRRLRADLKETNVGKVLTNLSDAIMHRLENDAAQKKFDFRESDRKRVLFDFPHAFLRVNRDSDLKHLRTDPVTWDEAMFQEGDAGGTSAPKKFAAPNMLTDAADSGILLVSAQAVRETLNARLAIDPVRLMALLEVFTYLKTEGMTKTVQIGGVGASGAIVATATTTAFTRSAHSATATGRALGTTGVTRRLTKDRSEGYPSGSSGTPPSTPNQPSTYLHPRLREKLFVRAVEVVRESSTDELWLLILEMAQNGVSREFDRSPIHIVIAEFARRGVHITARQKEFLGKSF